MPVDERTFQPMKILHGGASVVLAETLGSIAGSMAVNQEEFFVVGQSITSNHLRPVTHGWVTGMAHAKLHWANDLRFGTLKFGMKKKSWSIQAD